MTGGGVLEAWPQIWIGAGQEVGKVSDTLAGEVTWLCGRLADAGDAWSNDGLGLAFFKGDAKTPGFGRSRDQALSDLRDMVNILRGTGAALVASGRNYAAAEQANTVSGVPVSGVPVAAVQGAAPSLYELPAVTQTLVECEPPPAEWLQIVKLMEVLVGGCEWPRGNIARIQEMRDAFNDMADTIDRVLDALLDQIMAVTRSNAGLAAEEFASFASLLSGRTGIMQQLAAECRGLATFCDVLARQVKAAILQFEWSASFLVATFVAIQLLACVTAAMSEVAFLTVVRTEALGLRAFLLECGKYVLAASWYAGGMDTVSGNSRACTRDCRRGSTSVSWQGHRHGCGRRWFDGCGDRAVVSVGGVRAPCGVVEGSGGAMNDDRRWCSR